MFENLKKILRIYPLPVFILLLTFVVYYAAFEFINKEENNATAISQEESMQEQFPRNKEDNELLATNQIPQDSAQQDLNPKEIPQALPQPTQITYITSNTRSLNIRQEPNTSSNIVGKLTPAQTMLPLEEKNGWILVADSTTKKPIGWALKSFTKEIQKEIKDSEVGSTIAQSTQTEQQKQEIAPIQAPQEIVMQVAPQQTKDSTQSTLYASRVPSLNIRQSPSTQARILGKLTPNDSVSIVAAEGTWVKIQDSKATGKNGWVVRRSLTPKN